MCSERNEDQLRAKAVKAALEYYRVNHKKRPWVPGERIPYAGRVFDEKEIGNLVDSSLEFWLTMGRYAEKFEQGLAGFLGVKYCSLVNSGSSANLLAFMALTVPELGARRIKPGDEVITVAAGFPTTIAPIIQFGAVPVFADITLPGYNIDCRQLKKALSEKTKAVMLAHTLGNPFDVGRVKKFCEEHELWLIEDNCDSLGSRYNLNGQWGYTGTFGDLGTSSFYPPHHMSCSKNTPIPYLDEKGSWRVDRIDRIFELYVDQPEKIQVLSFDKDNKVRWTIPASILRHKLGQKKMMKIVCQHGRRVEVTEDHSVFVLDKNSAKIVPKQAGLIGKNDYIVVTSEIPSPGKIDSINILEPFFGKDAYVSGFSRFNLKYVKKADQRWQFKDRNTLPIKYLKMYDLKKEELLVGIAQSRKIPARLPVNEELFRLIGYFIAEGAYQNGLVFSFHKKERDLINDVKRLIKALFGLSVAVREAGNSAVIEVQSKNVEIVFSEIFAIKKGAKNKRIPWFIYHGDEKCIKAFIYGYTKGDGSERKRAGNTNHIDVTSVSLDLLNDFQYLLSRVGISASFYRRNIGKKKKIGNNWTTSQDNYTLSFSGYIYRGKSIVKQNKKERNNVALQAPLLDVFRNYISIGKGQKTISRKRLAKYIVSNSDLLKVVAGEVGFLKIRSIQEINYGENEYVYDFSVPGKENFYGGFLGVFLHNTMGEGGAVYTNDPQLKKNVESFRDWGRDCSCPSGKDNTCGKRFTQQFGALPYGYDHKYVYSHFGYNLKATDLQAAIGCAQLEKLPNFIAARRKNWEKLRRGLDELKSVFVLPEAAENSEPSWFGFLLTVKERAGFSRDEIVRSLESKGIQTRMLFAGNMVKHPCFDEMRGKEQGYRVAGELKNTDLVMKQAFWIGVYPGLTGEMIDYALDQIRGFCQRAV
ncbi:MAG: DegT/DnrJ/EryC1/StrS family aminotransferase [Candidatus Saganbacteria bacterium]|nr:DegT/DnrJ/EryC1/StrS family aminotransferase [Candidatus Saganbacteria bacterium]